MKNSKISSVEMLLAFMWTCPECGRDKFERSVVVELSQEEMAELREEHGVEVWEQGHFRVAPKTVECPHCKMEFGTYPYGQGD